MQSLLTTIKFVSDGTNAATSSSTATGDFAFLALGIFAIIVALSAVGVALFQRQKAAAVGELPSDSKNKFMSLIVIAAVAAVLGLSLTVAGSSQAKAHADGAALNSEEVVGTVDSSSGVVSFAEADITNTSNYPQVISSFGLVAAEGVTTISDVNWTIKIGDTVVHEGVVKEAQTLANPICVKSGETLKFSVAASNLSGDVAKALIGKDVAVGTSGYDVQKVTVTATADPAGAGTFDKQSVDVPCGTAYVADVDNSNITFGTGATVQTITFAPAAKKKLSKWLVDGKEATSGTITANTAFTAVTETAQTIRKVTNISYTGTTAVEQKVNFVPAYADSNKTYLKDNGVLYYTDAECKNPETTINALIESGCTMNQLYGVLKNGSEVKTLWAKANDGVKFYGVVDEIWDNVFVPNTETGKAKGYNTTGKFYNELLDDNKGIGTVYFTGSKESPTLSTEGNWDVSDWEKGPTLNNVTYGEGSTEVLSQFYYAYGGENGGILSSSESICPWSTHYGYGESAMWSVTYGEWGADGSDQHGGIAVSLFF